MVVEICHIASRFVEEETGNFIGGVRIDKAICFHGSRLLPYITLQSLFLRCLSSVQIAIVVFPTGTAFQLPTWHV